MGGSSKSAGFTQEAVRSNPASVVAFYRANGYVVIEGLWSHTEAGDLVHVAEGFLRRQPPEEKYKPLMNPSREDAAFDRALRDPRLVVVAECLLDSRVEALQMMFYWKPPGALGLDMHQDNYYVGSEQDALVSAWVALDDADEENGGLIVWPRSHSEPVLPVRDVPVPASTMPSFPNARGRETILPPGYSPLSVCVRRGDVVFIHGNLVHGSSDNRSQSRFRCSLLVDYIRHGAPFSTGRYAKRSRIDVYSNPTGP